MKKIRYLLLPALLLPTLWYLWTVFAVPAVPAHLPLPARQIEAGDWILRGGTSGDSRFIRYLSHSRFSHIGIAVRTEQGRLLIAHAATDDDGQRPNQVLLSTWEEFADIGKAETVAVLRPLFLDAAQRRASADYARRQLGRPFVLAAGHEPHFYCSTLIEEAVRGVYPAFSPRRQYVDIALYRGDYLFPAAFAEEAVEWISPFPNKD